MIFSTQPHNLLILSQHCDIYKQLIEEQCLPGLSIVESASSNPSSDKLDYLDIIFGEPVLVSTLLDRLSNLKWIQSTWAGVEPLVGPGKRTDYVLTNIRNVYGPLMSEYVFGYLLAIERKIITRMRWQEKRRWETSINGSLRGKLIGLAGVGSIGAQIASTAKHFGMRVYGFTRQSENCEYVDQYFHWGAWNEFAKDLDYLVCTLPGTQDTQNFIDNEALSALPAKSWFINVGRGSCLDEAALSKVLSLGEISGAVLDVFKEEPLPLNHSFWSLPNVYITCHTAAQNNPSDIASVFIDNYLRMIKGESLRFIVNFSLGY